jgi:multisubunit Na+/H+ antiporter MnhE subunit
MARWVRHTLQAVLLGIALEIFWIACAGSLHAHELIVGIPSVLLSAGFCLFAVRTLPISFRPSVAELAQVWRIPWSVVKDVALVVAVLAEDLAGRRAPSLFRSAPWWENAATGEDTARRTLAIAYTTVSPNFVVIGIDCGQGQVFFHQLRADEVPRLLRRLGAGDGR